MDYKYEIQEFLDRFGKKFNLNLEDLNWTESVLLDIYKKAKETRDQDDYGSGYDEGYSVGYKEGYAEAEEEFEEEEDDEDNN